MKQRSREINVFSVSALDLFASALGAFILMSLIFMVFFSMTSQDTSQADAIQATLNQCEVQLATSVDASELTQCQATQASLSEQIRQIRIPHLDVVICLDITGSMREQIARLKLEISDLARVLDGLAPSTGIGVVAYGDVVYEQVIHQHPIVETSSMESLRQFVDSLETGMGQGSGSNTDNPEALDTALRAAIAMNWRSQSERRYIIVITDAPAYPHEVASAISRARNFAQVGNQHISSVMVGRFDAESFLRELAGSGQGQFVNAIGGQSMLASVLLAIINL